MLDARAMSGDYPEPVDVCVIGGGPAGIAAALSLGRAGLRVLILEAGGSLPTIAGQRMLAGEQSGSAYWPLQNSRYLALGGSANRWGGISRPLDPIDFECRPWVADSGWPVSHAELAPQFAAAAEFLELPSRLFEPPVPTADGRVLAIDDPDLELIGYQTSPLINFGRTILPALAAARQVTVMLNAVVTELVPSADSDSIERVEVRSSGGNDFAVRPVAVLLCAGAIENARLLLASRRRRGAGLGNEHDVVGRYFMEHLHAPLGYLVTTARSANWSTYDLSNPAQPLMRSALSPSPATLREHRLLSASIAIGPANYGATPPFISWLHPLTLVLERAYFGLEDRGGRTARAADRGLNLARSAWGGLSTAALRRRMRSDRTASAHDLAAMRSIYIRGEQVPLPGNRVSLSNELDRIGRPRAALHWTVDEQSRQNSERLLGLFAAMARRQGLGTVVGPYPEWTSQIVGGPHHLGTTRMSSNPRKGVVDGTGRVHSLSNLYVAGSSLFPTGGHANPTFTLLALSIRVAESMAERVRSLRVAR